MLTVASIFVASVHGLLHGQTPTDPLLPARTPRSPGPAPSRVRAHAALLEPEPGVLGPTVESGVTEIGTARTLIASWIRECLADAYFLADTCNSFSSSADKSLISASRGYLAECRPKNLG